MSIRRSQPLANPFAEPPSAPLPPPPAAPMSFDELSCVGRLEACQLVQLPAPSTLVCRHVPSAREFWVTTSKPHFEAAARAHWPAMHGAQWLSCVAAAREHAAALAIGQWLIPRQPPPRAPAPPDWHILGPLHWLLGPHGEVFKHMPLDGLSIADALEHFGCTLLGVEPDIGAAAEQAQAGLL